MHHNGQPCFTASGLCAALLGLPVAFGIADEARGQSTNFRAWGTLTDASNPPADLPRLETLSFGGNHAIGLGEDGIARAWGSNTFGEATVPPNLGTVVAVEAGQHFSGALSSSGQIRLWGLNDWTQCDVPVHGEVAKFALGWNHGIALRSDGTVFAWGRQQYGAATIPAGLGTVSAVDAGDNWNAVILASTGIVRTWGYTFGGNHEPPSGSLPAAKIAAGSYHLLVLQVNGTVRAYPDKGSAETVVPPFEGSVKDIAAGSFRSLILLQDGRVIPFGADAAVPPPEGAFTGISSAHDNFGGLVGVDCNGNGIDDSVDIARAPWIDCNDNSVVDVGSCSDAGSLTAPIKWTAVTGGNFQDSSSWCFYAPTNSSSVVFPYSPAYNVYFSVNRTVRNMTVSDGFPTLNLGGRTLTLSSTSQPTQAYLHLGSLSDQPATLGLLGGTVSAQFTEVGSDPGAEGLLLLGPGGVSVSAQELCVGCEGEGEMRVLNGGRAVSQKGVIGRVPTAPGTVLVEGSPGNPDANPPIPPVISAWDSTLGIDVRNGTLTVGPQGVINSPAVGVVLFSGGVLEGSGQINGTVTNFGAAAGNCGAAGFNGEPIAHRRGGLMPGGASAAGSSAQGGTTIGTLTVNGVYQQIASNPLLGTNSGSLLVEVVPGPDGVRHDKLVVNGSASFGGGLFVDFPEGDPGEFSPLEIVRASVVDAQRPNFDVAVMPGLPDGRFVRVDPTQSLKGGGAGITISLANLSELLGFGDASTSGVPLVPLAAVTADFDGKNGPDLAVTTRGPTPSANGSLFVLLNDGAGGLLEVQQLELGVEPVDIVAAPLRNTSTATDLAVVNKVSGTLQLVLNQDGTFQTANTSEFVVQLGAGSAPVALAAAPIYSDPGLVGAARDIIVAKSGSNQISVFRNLGFGLPWFPPIILPTPVDPTDIDGVDIDNNRTFDMMLLTARGSSTVTAYSFDAKSQLFSDGIEFLTGEDPVSMEVADLDGDGLLDVTTVNAASNSVSVLVNRTLPGGAVNFAPAVSLPTGGDPVSVVAGDFDLDSVPGEAPDLDIAFTARATTAADAPRVVKILRNDRQNGVLVFAPAADQPVPGSPRIVLADEMDAAPGVDLVTVALGGDGETQFGGLVANASVRSSSGRKKPCGAGDVNCDGVVDANDLGMLLAAWGTADPAADLNDDGTVSADDLSLLLANWGDGQS